MSPTTPLLAEEAAKILIGSALDAATVKRAVAAAEAITSPAEDARGPAAYRTKMAGVMLTRALARAKSLREAAEGDRAMAKSQVAMKINGKTVEALVEPRTLLDLFPARSAQHHRPAYRLRYQPLRRLHRRSRRQVGEILHRVRGAGQRRRHPSPSKASPIPTARCTRCRKASARCTGCNAASARRA